MLENPREQNGKLQSCGKLCSRNLTVRSVFQNLRGHMLKSLCSFTLVVLLSACAFPQQIASGSSREQVVTRLGRPTRSLPLLGGGERLQYSFQPAGQVAWMVDLDVGGRVARVRQVLTEEEFQRIVPGEWTHADVEREFGPPGAWNGRVMTYRWRNAHGGDMLYWVYVDPHGVVRATREGSELPGNMTDL
jgi:hypothetical protein